MNTKNNIPESANGSNGKKSYPSEFKDQVMAVYKSGIYPIDRANSGLTPPGNSPCLAHKKMPEIYFWHFEKTFMLWTYDSLHTVLSNWFSAD